MTRHHSELTEVSWKDSALLPPDGQSVLACSVPIDDAEDVRELRRDFNCITQRLQLSKAAKELVGLNGLGCDLRE
jgi:hypothetical protein